MRVRNSGSGFQGFGGGRDRSDSFRQGRKPGQKVRGILIKWVSEDMAWVNIDGHKLLAQLHSTPLVGARLTFLIKQLSPNIILKEIFELSAAKQGPLEMASGFETARTLFENKFRSIAESMTKSNPESRHTTFITWLMEEPQALVTYNDALSCIQQINVTIGSQKDWNLHYIPWMLPEGRRHVAVIRQSSSGQDAPKLTEIHYECELGVLGLTRVEFLHKTPDVGYRLKTQYPAKSEELKRYMNSRNHTKLLAKPQCLGVSKLSPREHGGILSELMFAQ